MKNGKVIKDVKMKEDQKVSLADQATIPLHAMFAAKDVEMDNSVSDLIGMIDSGAARNDVPIKKDPIVIP